MSAGRFLKQFNWRFLLVRILVNALALAITAFLVPKISFLDRSIGTLLLLTLVLGLLNALLKPVLQILTLQFIFVTFGLVVVLMNAVLLRLLSLIFWDRFEAQNIVWLLVGGLVLGVVGSFFESLLGLTVPIVPEEATELRRQVEEQARGVDWRAVAGREAVPEGQALTIEPPAGEEAAERLAVAAGLAAAAGPVETEPAVVEPAVIEPAVAKATVAEASTPGSDAEASSPVEVEAEPVDSVTTPPAEAAISAEMETLAEVTISDDPEPTPEPQEEDREDPS